MSSEQDACRRRHRELPSDDLDAASDEWAERARHEGAHPVDGAERAAAAEAGSPGRGPGGRVPLVAPPLSDATSTRSAGWDRADAVAGVDEPFAG